MNITHKIPGQGISMHSDASSFMLSNGLGGFLFLSQNPPSKFGGLFFNDGLEIFKILDDICLVGSSPDELENHLSYIKRKHKSNAEKIFLPEGMFYSLDRKARIAVSFDCRKAYDMRSFGRYYDVSLEDGNIIVKFTKRTDSKEDGSHGNDEFSLFVAIEPKNFDAKNDYEFINRWEERHYSYDAERKDFPASRFVYLPFIINAKELLIAFGRSKEEAIAGLGRIKAHKLTDGNYLAIDKKRGEDAAAAFVCAQDSLSKLTVSHDGKKRFFAGLPWFFQLWSRDELISLGALIRLGHFKVVKDILFNHLRSIGADGRLANRIPSADLGNADGIGWLWKRVGDFIEKLEASDELGNYLSAKEIEEIRAALVLSIGNIEKSYMRDGLVTNRKNETWMDTDYNNSDVRDGACIEIQALHLNMLHLAHKLTGDEKYAKKGNVMRSDVLAAFWDGSMLADRAEDFTKRPNIFIAYYAYPDLLSRSEWESAFRHALDSLWLDWGGLSSIDKKHPLFTADYSGIDNRSYHRGDSWFWLNNLAAVCLLRNNAIAFEDNVRKIMEASSDEILWHGAVGHHAELSSASHLSAKGCFAQAWSAAMFIELMMEGFR